MMQSQFPLSFQEDNAGCGELFRKGADVKHRLRSDRHVLFQIGQAVAFRTDDFAITVNAERSAWRSCLRLIRKDIVKREVGCCCCCAETEIIPPIKNAAIEPAQSERIRLVIYECVNPGPAAADDQTSGLRCNPRNRNRV